MYTCTCSNCGSKLSVGTNVSSPTTCSCGYKWVALDIGGGVYVFGIVTNG